MAREVARLSDRTVRDAKPKMHADRMARAAMIAHGGGLNLHVTASGGKSWIYRYMLAGRPREMGLGPVNPIGLAEARRRVQIHRKQRYDGVDPIAARQAQRASAKLDAAKASTFRACAERYIAAHKDAWKNHKHAASDLGSLRLSDPWRVAGAGDRYRAGHAGLGAGDR